MRNERRSFWVAGLLGLAAVSVCQTGQGADFQGSLLERIRTSRAQSNANAPSGTSSFSSRRLQMTPLGAPKNGTTTVQPQRVMNFGPSEIITDAEKSLKKQLDPNAGHTLGKRKKKPAGTSNAGTGLSVGSKFDPSASLSRAGIDPNAGHTLGKRKKKTPLPSGGNTTPNPPPGGTGQTNPAPQMPAPQFPDPQNPAPTGGGSFPWMDIAGAVIPYVVNRSPVYETPVYDQSYVPATAETIVTEPAETVATEPAVVVTEPATVVNEPATVVEQTPTASGVELILEDIRRIAPATIVAGPAYEVEFRNQSLQPAGPFRVMIAVGLGKESAKKSPVVMEFPGLEAGDVGRATLRLPIAVMKLSPAEGKEAKPFSHLFVSVDSSNTVKEIDESNNDAVIERTALEPASE
ncbi:MAG: hypothetical protein AB7O26_21105 [Planctomycetaceae bacterium]